MAEASKNNTAATTPAPAPQAASNPSARFEISTPSSVFGGERMGIKFRDGKGYTDDPIKAHACLELGYSYLDRKTTPPKRYPPDPSAPKEPDRNDDGVNPRRGRA